MIKIKHKLILLDKVWTEVCKLNLSKKGERVLVRARLHTSRGTGMLPFYVLGVNRLSSKMNLSTK